MISLQILNKVLETQDLSMIFSGVLSEDYFVGYEEEFNFLMDHHQKYGQVPDKETFLDHFNNFELLHVGETWDYLLDKIREEYLYYQTVPIIKEAADLLSTDSNTAVEYLLNKVKELNPNYGISTFDIIAQAETRLKQFEEKMVAEKPWYITTGFPELDDIIHGWNKGEELAILFARTGQGKSWVLSKTLTHAWEIGHRVGYISPEMSPQKIGYRIDTLLGNFSNTGLNWAKETKVSPAEYKKYINSLGGKNGFYVSTPMDFQKKITISKLRNFIQAEKLDILGIDGITYLSDERYRRGDNKTTSLTNISEDLIGLSLDLGIPIIAVVQSNREGVREGGGTPDLENIRDSDGIAHNATKVLSIRQAGGALEIGVKKHRDGVMGGKVIYKWEPDTGTFVYIPADEDGVSEEVKEPRKRIVREQYQDEEAVF